MSPASFRVNLHSIIARISRNFLGETDFRVQSKFLLLPVNAVTVDTEEYYPNRCKLNNGKAFNNIYYNYSIILGIAVANHVCCLI